MDWVHQFLLMLLATALSSTVPVMLFILQGRRAAKKDVQKRHEENQKLMDEYKTAKSYIHSHQEKGEKQPLMVGGIVPR